MTDRNRSSENGDTQTARQRWLRVMALTEPARLSDQVGQRLDNQTFTWLRKPESGLYRLQGRLDSGGDRFNIADVIVTRCVVKSEHETAGVGYVQGRSIDHCTLVARLDSLLQCMSFQSCLLSEVIEPLAKRLRERHKAEQEQVERSRVQFYTMSPETI